MIDVNQTLGDVAATQPGASQVFLRHRLDFCCGGGRSLRDACRDAGLDPDVIIAEIAAETEPGSSAGWTDRPLDELVEFIVSHYHDRLRADLPGLIAAAQRVEHVHASKEDCPRGLASHLEHLQVEILQHLTKEEQVLFPAIYQGRRGAMIQMPVRMMMQEHDDHAENMQRSRVLAHNFEAPAEACGTWRALYAGLHQLERELMEHIHLENNVLFVRALND